jgi:hypothetical protein
LSAEGRLAIELIAIRAIAHAKAITVLNKLIILCLKLNFLPGLAGS